MFFNLSCVFDFVHEQVHSISYIECVKKVFHSQAYTVEHFSAFRAAHGNNHSTPVTSCGSNERLFQHVLVGPEALATVDESFCLSGDGHKEDGGSKDYTVGIEHFCGDDVVIIFDDTASSFVTAATLDAGGDFEIRQSEIFGFGPG